MASKNGLVGIKIPALRVVGMSHYGSSQLQKEAVYQLRREPNNPYDQMAVAVVDGDVVKAHLKKEDAGRLATIMDSNLLVGNVYIKFHHDATVKSPKTGPQQIGNVGVRCAQENLDAVSQLLAKGPLNFEVLTLKSKQ